MKPLAFALAVAFAVPSCWAGTAGTGRSQPAATQQAASQNPAVAPIFARPSGKSYSEWAGNWWQWALQTPATAHPVFGGACSTGQTGRVWFLGVNFSGGGNLVSRSCVVPSGTALFVQLISSAYFAFLNDPPETRTEEFLRAAAECSNFQAQSVRINGTEVRNPAQYLERSALFDVQLPIDNVFGVDSTIVPQLKLSPGVDMGYYLFIRPLAVGTHEISWQVSMDCQSLGTIYQNQTLSISVVPAAR